MSDLAIRLGVLLLVCLLLWLVVWSGRRFVAGQREQALTAPLPDILGDHEGNGATPAADQRNRRRARA